MTTLLNKLLFLTILIYAVVGQNPQWCTDASNQQTNTYTLCKNPGQAVPRSELSSWCHQRNFHSELPINFKDQQFNNNCSLPGSHCIEIPNEPSFMKPKCFKENVLDDVTFSDGTRTFANTCHIVNFVQPFELVTKAKEKKELLFVSLQTGFSLIDFREEKPAQGQSVRVSDKASFEYSEIVGDNFEKAYVVGVRDNNIYSWSFEWSDTGLVSNFVGEGTFVGNFTSLTTFYDAQSKRFWAAVSVSDKIEFFQIDQQGTFANTIEWRLTVPAYASFVKIGHVIQSSTDTTSFKKTTNIQCIPTFPGEDRVLIMIYHAKSVYLLGFAANQAGRHDIDLTEANAIGKYLYYEAPTGKFITSAHVYKDCFGDTKGQQIWLAVALNLPASQNYKLQIISLAEFSQVDFTCIGGGSNWWKNPSGVRKTDKCETITTKCPTSTQFREYDTNKGSFECKERPSVIEKTLTENIKSIKSALSTDTKPITPATDLGHTYMRVLFLSGNHNIDVYGVQESACQSQVIPVVTVLNSIPISKNIHDISVSHNGQHLFSTLTVRDWEIVTHLRLIEVCAKLSADPTNTLFSRFKAQCDNLSPNQLNIYDMISYHSQCNGGWFCPLFGSVGQNTPENRAESVVQSGNHVIRPTKTYQCEKGFYCPGAYTASRVKCPIGFKCKDVGMKYPIRCDTGANFDKACLVEGLAEETNCPDGLICKTPRVAVDSPPGHFVDGNNRRIVQKCSSRTFCPLRNSKVSNSTLCPAGFSCPQTSVGVPIKCVTNVTSISHYCPAGTTDINPQCPVGFECPNTVTKNPCSTGQFCPNGTAKAKACPAGFYCPTPFQNELCPGNYYCEPGSVRPIRCQYLVWWCFPGTTEKQVLPVGLITVFVLVLLAVIFIRVFKFCCTRIKKRAKKKGLSRQKSLLNKPFNLTMGYIKHPLDLEFQDLQFIKKKSNGVILDGVTASFPNGSLIGVLGEELEYGRALADIIAGRSYYGFTNGGMKVNDVPVSSLGSYSHLVGYIPEKDEFRKQFTIIDEIKWTTYPKMNNIFQLFKTNKKIQKILDILDMKWLQKKLVGKKEDPLGLSNGQYKKIAIAVELAQDPSVLVLVNPFDNVDLHERKELMEIFRKLNETNLTVIIILDQPRYEEFTEFDKVLLLGKQGQTVYFGPSKSCMQYFIELGFKCSKHGNPADLITDIISGTVDRNGDSDYSQEKLGYLWQIKQKEQKKPWFTEEKKPLPEDEIEIKKLELKKAKKNKRMGCCGQYLIFSMRSFLELLSHLKGTIYEILFVFIAASLVGSLYTNMEFVGPLAPALQKQCPSFANCELPISDQIPTIGIVTIAAIALLSIQASEKLFVFDKHLYKREAQTGISRLAYYLGKLTAHLPNNLIIPALFLLIWEISVAPRQLWIVYYAIYLLVNWCWSSFGYFNTLLFKRSTGLFYASMVVIWSSILSGFRPSLKVLNQLFLTQILSYMSPTRYALELLYLSELDVYRKEGINVQTALDSYGYSYQYLWVNVLALIAFGLIFRILGFIVLYFQDPRVMTTVKFLYTSCLRRCCKFKKKKKQLTLQESINQRNQEDVEDEYQSDHDSGPDQDDEEDGEED